MRSTSMDGIWSTVDIEGAPRYALAVLAFTAVLA